MAYLALSSALGATPQAMQIINQWKASNLQKANKGIDPVDPQKYPNFPSLSPADWGSIVWPAYRNAVDLAKLVKSNLTKIKESKLSPSATPAQITVEIARGRNLWERASPGWGYAFDTLITFREGTLTGKQVVYNPSALLSLYQKQHQEKPLAGLGTLGQLDPGLEEALRKVTQAEFGKVASEVEGVSKTLQAKTVPIPKEVAGVAGAFATQKVAQTGAGLGIRQIGIKLFPAGASSLTNVLRGLGYVGIGVEVVLNFYHGNIAGGIGTLAGAGIGFAIAGPGGAVVGSLIGSFIGNFVGGLFGGSKKARIKRYEAQNAVIVDSITKTENAFGQADAMFKQGLYGPLYDMIEGSIMWNRGLFDQNAYTMKRTGQTIQPGPLVGSAKEAYARGFSTPAYAELAGKIWDSYLITVSADPTLPKLHTSVFTGYAYGKDGHYAIPDLVPDARTTATVAIYDGTTPEKAIEKIKALITTEIINYPDAFNYYRGADIGAVKGVYGGMIGSLSSPQYVASVKADYKTMVDTIKKAIPSTSGKEITTAEALETFKRFNDIMKEEVALHGQFDTAIAKGDMTTARDILDKRKAKVVSMKNILDTTAVKVGIDPRTVTSGPFGATPKDLVLPDLSKGAGHALVEGLGSAWRALNSALDQAGKKVEGWLGLDKAPVPGSATPTATPGTIGDTKKYPAVKGGVLQKDPIPASVAIPSGYVFIPDGKGSGMWVHPDTQKQGAWWGTLKDALGLAFGGIGLAGSLAGMFGSLTPAQLAQPATIFPNGDIFTVGPTGTEIIPGAGMTPATTTTPEALQNFLNQQRDIVQGVPKPFSINVGGANIPFIPLLLLLASYGLATKD